MCTKITIPYLNLEITAENMVKRWKETNDPFLSVIKF